MFFSNKPIAYRTNIWPKILAFLFFVQALFFSIFITPLGDIPDESGHFAYVVDITKGRPLPTLGRTDNERGYIPLDLWWNWETTSTDKRINYIVQHPPLYYILASVPYSIAKKFTNDKKIHAQAIRSISAISLGLMVFVIFKILTTINIPAPQATLISIWPALLPMTTHLGSGITNDILLTLICALATLYLIKFLLSQNIHFAYYCAFWLALAGATKMTAWILIGACLTVIAFELRQPFKSWIKHTFMIGALSLSTAIYWMFRNFKLHGEPFKVYIDSNKLNFNNIEFWDFFKQQPFIDWLFKHTYSLHGFTGHCSYIDSPEILSKLCKGPKFESIQSGTPYIIFIAIALAIGFLILLKAWVNLKSKHTSDSKNFQYNSIQSSLAIKLNSIFPKSSFLNFTTLIASMSIMLYFIVNGFKISSIYSNYIYISLACILGASFISIKSVLFNQDAASRVFSYGLIFLTTFAIFLFYKGYQAYSLTSVPSGIQGRYLFPYFPFFLASIGFALNRNRITIMITALITILMVFAHLDSYLNTIIPFYNSTRL